jgi:hypothetical protein
LPVPRPFQLIDLRLFLVVEVRIHRRMSVPMLLREESPMPHVHQLLGCTKVSVAGTINANYTTGLPFNLPRQ